MAKLRSNDDGGYDLKRSIVEHIVNIVMGAIIVGQATMILDLRTTVADVRQKILSLRAAFDVRVEKAKEEHDGFASKESVAALDKRIDKLELSLTK